MTVPVKAVAVLKHRLWSKAKGQYLYSLSVSESNGSSAYLTRYSYSLHHDKAMEELSNDIKKNIATTNLSV